ncbi:hypothetical protein C8Q76DRAFT_694658 [Earliella scabrosa]|nr:hypothetical protein C8Q76DRAFT_694658 [Earliella scabrosa]
MSALLSNGYSHFGLDETYEASVQHPVDMPDEEGSEASAMAQLDDQRNNVFFQPDVRSSGWWIETEGLQNASHSAEFIPQNGEPVFDIFHAASVHATSSDVQDIIPILYPFHSISSISHPVAYLTDGATPSDCMVYPDAGSSGTLSPGAQHYSTIHPSSTGSAQVNNLLSRDMRPVSFTGLPTLYTVGHGSLPQDGSSNTAALVSSTALNFPTLSLSPMPSTPPNNFAPFANPIGSTSSSITAVCEASSAVDVEFDSKVNGGNGRLVHVIEQTPYGNQSKRANRANPRQGDRVSYGANGFSLAEAYAENLHGLEDSEKRAFPKEKMKQKRSVRLQFEDYAPTTRQVNVLKTRGSGRLQPTKGWLAVLMAREIRSFMDKHPSFSESYSWDQLVLLHVDVVSKGSLQPTIGIRA